MIKIKVEGVEKAMAGLENMGKQVRFALALGLTRTAYDIRKETVSQMRSRLDRPRSQYTLRQAVQVDEAKPEWLKATVGLGVKYDAPSKGSPYEKALGHLFKGGTRDWKKMEGAFRRINALPAGYMMVPGDACPLDGNGNPPRGLIVQLISYFNASSEQGYKANMSDKRRRSLAKEGRTERGYKTINGVQYFISYGRRGRPGGDRYVNGRHDQHLHPGIWSRSGIHGVQVRPIFMFVKRGAWRRYFNLEAIATGVITSKGKKNFESAIAYAMRTAKK